MISCSSSSSSSNIMWPSKIASFSSPKVSPALILIASNCSDALARPLRKRSTSCSTLSAEIFFRSMTISSSFSKSALPKAIPGDAKMPEIITLPYL
uniref:Uncharacterized protein n=1 Tax=Anopheles aquasalis TaxID=42839 RepID=T1E8F6_ANOAQ